MRKTNAKKAARKQGSFLRWRCRESNPGPDMLVTNVYEHSRRSKCRSEFVGQRSSPEPADKSLLRVIDIAATHPDLVVRQRPLSGEEDAIRGPGLRAGVTLQNYAARGKAL